MKHLCWIVIKGAPCRQPRKHGAKAQKRGISNEYVCILTGAERGGNAMAETVNRVKPSSRELESIFKGHILEGTLVLCDGLRSYRALERSIRGIVKDVTAEKGKKFFNLNTVNGFHSFIKGRYAFCQGVATKYINHFENGLVVVRERFIGQLI